MNNQKPDSAEDHSHSLHGKTCDRLPVAPSLDPVIHAVQEPQSGFLLDRRVLRICFIAILLGLVAAVAAMGLLWLIGLITNLAFYGRFSFSLVDPAAAVDRLGLWVIPIPVMGALIIGMMARYGSKAISGHGIPEAMEQILTNRSRIPIRVMFLKPLSSAISIGTGGPFGAEGPIIATAGALGSVTGQLISITAAERKTLLAAGAAGGMAATFGSPVSAVLLAVELLLFEYRPRSIIPVALAATAATGMRIAFEGGGPVFAMPDLAPPGLGALAFYTVLGGMMGFVAVLVTKIVYAVEDAFERLPIHWMWWPALGAIVVGVVGYIAPKTLGVGYGNITAVLSNDLPLQAVAFLCIMKLLSWSVSLGSGTSGGTLAPLFTIGGGIGAVFGGLAGAILPAAGIDIRIAALVGMAAIFAGASRALLASAVFAFETTLQPMGLLPLLGGCAAAYLVSSLVMRNTIMTEKIARRGVRTPVEYAADPLDLVFVDTIASKPVVALRAQDLVKDVRAWVTSGAEGSAHQGFPVLDADDRLLGVLTRRDFLTDASGDARIHTLLKRSPVFVYTDSTVRQAADLMVEHDIGRLPVVNHDDTLGVVGMVTRSDILSCNRHRIEENQLEAPSVRLSSLYR